MRVKKALALLLVVLFLSAPAVTAAGAAADGMPAAVLEQYAAELTQGTSYKYYKCENTQRYMDYRQLHPDYTLDAVISYVNIGLDRTFYDGAELIAVPGSVQVLVNKYNRLPKSFVPAGLEAINSSYSSGTQKLTHAARAAFEKMCAGAGKAGCRIYAVSAYRSYARQAELYESYTPNGNPATRDLYVARPGYSEHQTGLAVDVNHNSAMQGSDPVYQWLEKNAYKYGFILRFPKDKENVTGYAWEPWHLRYIGSQLAAAVHGAGLTYDEYYVREVAVPQNSPANHAVGITAAAAVTVDGITREIPAVRVGGCTYYKLRDVAAVLGGTSLCFSIAWDSEYNCIQLEAGTPGVSDAPGAGVTGRCVNMTAAPVMIACGDTIYDVSAYLAYDANYVRLEELAPMLGCTVFCDETGAACLQNIDAESVE